jgi:hypothetical protein
MNERIKAIAEHCDFYVGNEHYDKSHEEHQRLFMEKFAELIIRECAKACDDVSKDSFGDWRGGAWECETAILERFGVEK